MSPEDLQKLLNALNATLQNFTADVEEIAKGLPKNEDNPSIISENKQKENNKKNQEDSSDLTSNEKEKQQKIAVIFSKKFEEIFKKYFEKLELQKKSSDVENKEEKEPASLSLFGVVDSLVKNFGASMQAAMNFNAAILKQIIAKIAPPSSDELEVLSGEAKPTNVNIVSIDEKVIKALSKAFDFEIKQEKPEQGGVLGFISSIIALGPLAGASLTALAAGIASMTAALAGLGAAAGPVSIGLLVIATAIPVFALSFSLAAAIIVGALWLIKKPLLDLMPVFEMFGKLFKDYILQPILDALPNIIPALAIFLQIFKELMTSLLATIAPVLQGIVEAVKIVVQGIADLANNIVKGIVTIISAIADTINTIVNGIAKAIDVVYSSIVKLAEIFSNALMKSLNTVKEGMIIFRDVFKSLPDVTEKIFNSILDFSNNVDPAKISTAAISLGALAGALLALTGGNLLESITSFFVDSPFDKVIDFQNQLDLQKIAGLTMIAAAMEKISKIDVDSFAKFDGTLYNMKFNVDKLAVAFENLLQKMPGESTWAVVSNFASKATDALSNIFKNMPQAELNQTIKVIHYNADAKPVVVGLGALGETMVKVNDAHTILAKAHIEETKGTNKILNSILQKMQEIKMPVVAPAAQQKGNEYKSFPLQFTAVQTRQQMLAAGYS